MLNGQITVSGITQFPSVKCHAISIKAHPDNTDSIFIGDSAVSASTGYPLNAGEAVTLILDAGNINEVYAYPDVADEVLCWILVDA